jgi:hypothetical protein
MAQKKIAGIHNYCDRWCERCAFTDRCSIYQREDLVSEDYDKEDVEEGADKLFWEKVSQNISKAKTLLEDLAEKSGVDLNALSEEIEKSEVQEKGNRKKTEEHTLSLLSREYAITTQQWLKTQPGMMQKLETMKEDLTLGIESQERARADMEMIKDSLAVIQWYSEFIFPKLSRALMGKLDHFDMAEIDNDPQQDFNGSAKIALIAIEKSKDAWVKLFDLLPEQEDHFLSILGMLERLKRETLVEFPDCNKFVRPGFDEV